MLTKKGKSGGFFKNLSKDTRPWFSSISTEIRSRALSKGLIFTIEKYWGLKVVGEKGPNFLPTDRL